MIWRRARPFKINIDVTLETVVEIFYNVRTESRWIIQKK